nr:hypothetical protein B0A51_10805 [Rachicladosporium sp. CCFEE 5018]
MAVSDTPPADLTPEQTSTLFDILSHHETYREIEAFKQPGAIHAYGPPFQDNRSSTNSPVLQTLLAKFVLQLPGLRDVSPSFWKTQVADLIDELCEAELSESYDKGVLGIRKTLATAVSALIEYPARGSLGAFPEKHDRKRREYNTKNSDDVLQAWQDCLQEIVYGDLIEELFSKAAETDDLEQHAGIVRGMHEFVVVNLASFMHYTLVLSPEGPALLRMIGSVHGLLPYSVIRQTLKVGNVATMISGVMRIMLAKVSVSAVTNWMGLSSGADEGMNLLQQIISQVLGWEKRELKSRATKIEKAKDGPPKAVLKELNDWIATRSRAEHEEARRQSKEQGHSIVTIILALSSQPTELSEKQHAQALEYLTLTLGVRDRQEIIRVLCSRNPDHLTVAIRDGVDAYTPMIRDVHQAVNLSDTVWDFERFLTDMLKISKPQGKKSEEKPPAVEDFVDLLHRHQLSSHKFIHQVCKNSKPLVETWKAYVNTAAAQFRADAKAPKSSALIPDSASPPRQLSEAYSHLSSKDQEAVSSEISAYTNYLHDLHAASATRIGSIIRREYSAPFGPGAYLARWQQLMDATAVTPATPKGEVRFGSSKSVRDEARTDVDGETAGDGEEVKAMDDAEDLTPKMPDVSRTIELLGERFREILGGA